MAWESWCRQHHDPQCDCLTWTWSTTTLTDRYREKSVRAGAPRATSAPSVPSSPAREASRPARLRPVLTSSPPPQPSPPPPPPPPPLPPPASRVRTASDLPHCEEFLFPARNHENFSINIIPPLLSTGQNYTKTFLSFGNALYTFHAILVLYHCQHDGILPNLCYFVPWP